MTTFTALQKVKANKATGPDNIPANIPGIKESSINCYFQQFNARRRTSSGMEDGEHNTVAKINPPMLIEKVIRPISLTPQRCLSQ